MKTKTATVARPPGPRAAPELLFAFRDAKAAAQCARALAEAPGMSDEAAFAAQVAAKDADKALKKAARKLERSIADHAELNAALGRAAR